MQDLFGLEKTNTPSGRKAFCGITIGQVLKRRQKIRVFKMERGDNGINVALRFHIRHIYPIVRDMKKFVTKEVVWFQKLINITFDFPPLKNHHVHEEVGDKNNNNNNKCNDVQQQDNNNEEVIFDKEKNVYNN